MAMTRAETNRQAAIKAALAPFVGPAPDPDADGVPADLGGLRTLFRTVLGQQMVPSGTEWPMSCNRSANRLSALELQFAALQNLVSAKFADLAPRLQLAEQTLTKTQAELAANRAADALADAKDNLLESAVRANTLDIAALKLQALADEALLSSTASAAAAAQFTASVARSEAQAAQQKADADAVATLAVKAVAEAAQASASQAQAALAALAGRFRTKQMSTPAVALGGTMTLQVVWDQPFADTNYNAIAEFEGLAVLNLTAVVTNRTATGCTVSSKNVLGLALLAGVGTVTITAIHAAPTT
jgi:hypothetical protein